VALIAGKRVAIANDVVNAGSAVRGTYDDLNSAPQSPSSSDARDLGTGCVDYFAERDVHWNRSRKSPMTCGCPPSVPSARPAWPWKMSIHQRRAILVPSNASVARYRVHPPGGSGI